MDSSDSHLGAIFVNPLVTNMATELLTQILFQATLGTKPLTLWHVKAHFIPCRQTPER